MPKYWRYDLENAGLEKREVSFPTTYLKGVKNRKEKKRKEKISVNVIWLPVLLKYNQCL